MASALAKRVAFSASGALAHAVTACLRATPSTAWRAPESASVAVAAAAPIRAVTRAGPSRAENRAISPARKIAMPANWPRCTTVQLSLWAYSANTSWWSFASPPVCRKVTTMYRSCPASNSVAGRRSDARRVGGSVGAGLVAGSTAGWADMAPPRKRGVGRRPRWPLPRSLTPVKSPGFTRGLAGPVGTVPAVLAGRAPERAAIATLLDAARTGHGGALVVRGVAGSGKSTLLADALTGAADARMLRTSGVESESTLGVRRAAAAAVASARPRRCPTGPQRAALLF